MLDPIDMEEAKNRPAQPFEMNPHFSATSSELATPRSKFLLGWARGILCNPTDRSLVTKFAAPGCRCST